jgi:endogenous inhibitor of DNA gyrase (YacG/DUF329 family)
MVVKNCEHCGKRFEYKHPSKKQRFCSKSCVALWGRSVGRYPQKPRTGSDAACEVCGQSFYVKLHMVSSRRFCSAKCMHVWQLRDSVVRPCEWCGAEMKMPPAKAKVQRFCSVVCGAEGRRRNALDRTHNGRRVQMNQAGYIKVWEPENSGAHEGWMLEHRVVMERHLGRLLSRTETVHHQNGVKDDNRLENLVVLSRAAHTAVTNKETVAKRKRERAELAEYRKRYGELVLP